MDTLARSLAAAIPAAPLVAAGRWLRQVASGWRAARRAASEQRAFEALDDAAVRDLGMSRSEYGSYWAEARGLAPRTRVRTARALPHLEA